MCKTLKILLLMFIACFCITAAAHSSSEWVVSFSSSNYIVVSSTNSLWNQNGYIELSTDSVRLLQEYGNVADSSYEGNPTDSGIEYGYIFTAVVDGYITKLYRYALAQSTDNVIMHFWDDNELNLWGGWNRCIATATLTTDATGWQGIDVSSPTIVFKSGFNNIPIKATVDYRVSIIVSTTTPGYTKYPHTGGGPVRSHAPADVVEDIVTFRTDPDPGLFESAPGGYPNNVTNNFIFGIPDCEMTYYMKTGEFNAQVYDTGVSSPRYKAYISSASIPSNASVSWQFAASDNPAGPFNFQSYPGGDLSTLPHERYLKFKTQLIASSHRGSPLIYGVTIQFNQAPSTFTIISPPDAAVIGTYNPKFNWNPSFDPDGDVFTYTIQISEQSGFDTLYVSSSGIPSGITSVSYRGTFPPAKPLIDFNTYYWRIGAVDQGTSAQGVYEDTCTWVGPYFFTTSITTPLTILSSYPVDDGRIFASELISNDTSFYEIGIRFSKQFDSTTVKSSEFSFVNDNEDDMYYNFFVWATSITFRINVSTVPTIENSMMYTITVPNTIKVEEMPTYLTGDNTVQFATLISSEVTVSFGGLDLGYEYELTIPTGATSTAIYVQRKALDEDTNSTLNSANISANINELLRSISENAYNFTASDINRAEIESFSTKVDLKMSYESFDQDYLYDISDPENPIVRTDSLRIFRIGETSGDWELVQDQDAPDKANRTITAHLPSLSIYGILAYNTTTDVLSGLLNKPNPFAAGTENTTIYYILREDSTLTLSKVYIKIYNLIGDMVKIFGDDVCPMLGSSGGTLNSIDWDGRNGLGRAVADGCYICCITVEYSDENGDSRAAQKLLKVAVIK